MKTSQNNSAQNPGQTNTQAQTRQYPHGIRDLIGFELPALTSHFPRPDEMTFILDGDDEDLERLRNAVRNSAFTLHRGIEAISDLLITVDIHCPDEVDRQSRIGANSLIFHFAPLLEELSNISWQLDRATAAFGGGK